MSESPASTVTPLPRGSAALTVEQVRALQKELTRQFEYLRRLRERINKRRWPDDDPLAAAVQGAIDAMHTLHFCAMLLPGDLRRYDFAKRLADGTPAENSSAADVPARPGVSQITRQPEGESPPISADLGGGGR